MNVSPLSLAEPGPAPLVETNEAPLGNSVGLLGTGSINSWSTDAESVVAASAQPRSHSSKCMEVGVHQAGNARQGGLCWAGRLRIVLLPSLFKLWIAAQGAVLQMSFQEG